MIVFDTEQIYKLFYSAQADNIEIALLQASHFAPDLLPKAQSLLQLYEFLFGQNDTTQGEKIAYLLNLTELKLQYIHRLPTALWLMPQLKVLEIEHFAMSALPPDIQQLDKLEKLSLNFGFGFRKIPPEIGALTQLKELDLDNNAIEELPETIGQLQQLQKLSLRANCLQSLPDTLSELKQLKKFYLAQNQLEKSLIPSFLFNKTKTNPVIVATLRRVFKI